PSCWLQGTGGAWGTTLATPFFECGPVSELQARLLDCLESLRDIHTLPASRLERLADEIRGDLSTRVVLNTRDRRQAVEMANVAVALHAAFDPKNSFHVWQHGPHGEADGVLRRRLRRLRTAPRDGTHLENPVRKGSGLGLLRTSRSRDTIRLAKCILEDARVGPSADCAVAIVHGVACLEEAMQQAALEAPLPGKRLVILVLDDWSQEGFVERDVNEPLGAQSPGCNKGHVPWRIADVEDLPGLLETLSAAASAPSGNYVVCVRHGLTKRGPCADESNFGTAKNNIEPCILSKLFELLEQDRGAVCVADPALFYSHRDHLEQFSARFHRAESDAASALACGAALAARGMRPFVLLSPEEPFDDCASLLNDIASQQLPVRLVCYGPRQKLRVFFSSLPFVTPDDLCFAFASDEHSSQRLLESLATKCQGPSVSLLAAHSHLASTKFQGADGAPEIGRGQLLRTGKDVAILALGVSMDDCLSAATLLAGRRVSATVADACFLNPLDHEIIGQLARSHKALVLAEACSNGRFSARVLEYLANKGALDRGLRVRTLVADHSAETPFVLPGKIATVSLDALGIISAPLADLTA
ncbi:MAG: transketolase C-terminal domain-containing protein, partial [Pseudomonadota bacterium]